MYVLGSQLGIVIVDKIPNSSDMIVQLFRKGKCAPNPTGYSLPKRAIEPLDMIGLSRFFANRLVSVFWKDTPISLPKIGIAGGILLVEERQ
jgi:hypothetical protein